MVNPNNILIKHLIYFIYFYINYTQTLYYILQANILQYNIQTMMLAIMFNIYSY